MIKAIVKLLSFAVFILAFSLVISNKQAAAFGLNPNPRPNGIPGVNATELENCNGQPPQVSPAFQPWLSDQANWSNQVVTVPYGTTQVQLSNHWASSICSTPVIVPESHAITTAATVISGGGTINGAVNKELILINGNSVGDYRHTWYNFTYDTAPLTTSKTITVQFTQIGINYITDGRDHTCIGGNERSNLGGWVYILCSPSSYTLNIRINVSPPPSAVIRGRVFYDDDNNGIKNGTEAFVQTGTPCGGAYPNINVTVTVSPNFGSDQPNSCNGGGPLWSVTGTTFGAKTITIAVPPGYRVTTLPYPRTGTAVSGTTLDIPAFGIRKISPIPRCGNFTPPDVEPGQGFDISVFGGSVGNVTAATPYTITVNVTNPRTIYNGTIGTGTIPAGSDTTATHMASIGGQLIGHYVGSYTVTFPGSPEPPAVCPVVIDVAAKPFFTVKYGDISSGINGTSCAGGWPTTNGKLVGWSNGANTGAGTTLAALALSKIDGVLSAKAPSGSVSPSELSFANRPPPDTGLYGATIDCPNDYFSKANGGPPSSTIPDATVDYQGSGFTLSGMAGPGSSLTGGHRVAVYITGDVYINGNLRLTNNAGAGLAGLSNFYLVVKGNIYIAPNVTQLEGVYIAQGDSASGSGQIYTCAQPNAPPTADMLNNACRTQLMVNGAFIADKVNLYRSFGTLKDAVVGADNGAAEIFKYTPSAWLAPPSSIAQLFGTSSGTPSSGGYDAITSLSPVL